MAQFDWQMREQMKEWATSGRLVVLTTILLHSNAMLRAHPGNDLLMYETGLSSGTISGAIKWMLATKAVLLVPFGQRIGNEIGLPNHKNIYQLTGVIQLSGHWQPYLYLTPEGWHMVAAQIQAIGDNSLVNYLASEYLASERKGVKEIFKVDSKSISGEVPDGVQPEKKDAEVLRIEADPIWIAFAAGWDEMPMLPEVRMSLVATFDKAMEALRPGLEAGTYTLDDLTELTRQQNRLKRNSGSGYRLPYIKGDLPDYLAGKQATAAAEARIAAARAAAAANAAYQPMPQLDDEADRYMSAEERQRVIEQATATMRANKLKDFE